MKTLKCKTAIRNTGNVRITKPLLWKMKKFYIFLSVSVCGYSHVREALDTQAHWRVRMGVCVHLQPYLPSIQS